MVVVSSIKTHPYLEEVMPNHLGFIGKSPSMIQVYETIKKVGPKNVTANIVGESGTGKELVAKALHKLSGRKIISGVNCGAFIDTILESLLFGVEKGVATGVSERKGLIELSNEGTLFLDEISDMSPHMQVALLRVLQEGKIIRVGADYSKPLDVNVRVITASSSNLENAVSQGRFREDLYYRLCVVPISLPSLRERREDIEDLTKYFCGRFCVKHDLDLYLSEEAIEFLSSYNWPGNIRELERAMEKAIILYKRDNNILDAEDFEFLTPSLPVPKVDLSTDIGEGIYHRRLVKSYEIRLIEAALKLHKGSVTNAAKYLKLGITTLRTKCTRLGIDVDKYRNQ